MLTIFWLVLVAIMLVIEIFTLGLTTIWFSLGGVAAAIAAGLNSPLWLQIVLFAGVSVVVMVLVRPFAVKVLDKKVVPRPILMNCRGRKRKSSKQLIMQRKWHGTSSWCRMDGTQCR